MALEKSIEVAVSINDDLVRAIEVALPHIEAGREMLGIAEAFHIGATSPSLPIVTALRVLADAVREHRAWTRESSEMLAIDVALEEADVVLGSLVSKHQEATDG